ncbi:prephenate dehydrogenase/arogenate dehydrogenase family protein [Geomonas nitrogeniifigens]|uniref:Prephenate dehydrogenase/arogenate dehydrogenase family protein n=1 Tax=Geomonas diazotrophica TaxID=2843197 RepID=A0ABX8JP63_9BACT|nr:prephenate dehydrogenase/arogenate dehydrogenase family protein [Geomonas nitrogeniifigens]QWV98397.1 prephenate dehydrogenase/arogenate dehydrogenase family protein [Geomonas nitrogeniifigens]QXE87579.1 prephenate dehydrogenase/arogenate dehydrogenase family protein [Geomonas nitrogeniifigens]
MVYFKKMAVIGVGLIGGSLARVLREKGAVGEVVGVGRGEANLKRGVELGVLDSYTTDAREGVAGADLVFVATPVCTIPNVVAEIAPCLAPGCIVTDGGSVKETVVSACESLMPEGTFFVGGHPIAGTEHSGVEASFSTLYMGRRCIVTPTPNTDPVALEKVVELWKIAGSTVPLMDPVQHDLVVAAISHLPHMVAYSLVNAVDGYDRFGGDLLSFSAGGFRDFTRIASSDPVMWRDIALTNREAILEMMDFFSVYLEKLRTLVAEGDADGLQAFFLNSKQKRDAIL